MEEAEKKNEGKYYRNLEKRKEGKKEKEEEKEKLNERTQKTLKPWIQVFSSVP